MQRLAAIDYTAEMEHDGRAYLVTVSGLDAFVCDKCGAKVLPDASQAKLEHQLRRQAGLLMPSEITERRERLQLSQSDFAGLLGVAAATVARWETGGQIQQRVMNDFMRAFFDLPSLRSYLRGTRAGGPPSSEDLPKYPIALIDAPPAASET
jgi:putative zinc finger/helix-turn-helix YgiT family protein